MKLFILFFFVLATVLRVQGQATLIYLQLNSDSKLRKGNYQDDSLQVRIYLRKKDLVVNSFTLTGYLLGKNSTLIVAIPDSILSQGEAITIIDAIDYRGDEGSEILGKFDYLPFDFIFKTKPANAQLYLVPLFDWENKFKTLDLSKINFTKNQLEQFSLYKINKNKTPVTIKVFEQPYIAIFFLNGSIRLVHVKPIRRIPEDNIIEIDIN
jgi:hypothetical protein